MTENDNSNGLAIGIDLGTTNCALASVGLETRESSPAPFAIPQLVQPSEVASKRLLPSFIYLPAAGELPADALALPWNPDVQDAVGAYARSRGAESPARLVASAKSWLSYGGVDRRAAILPWQAPDDVPQLSPLDASARYLRHLRQAWDTQNPDTPLAQQSLVLTVPASFDAVARELTVEAAQQAGLGEAMRLLEEPQAALYAWLADQGTRWRDVLSVGDVVLVCDLGGGTTDFSLIAVRERDGALQLERLAVGDHILLGGDNMDLALAYAVRTRLEKEGTRLDDWQMRALTHGCRTAKEALLDDDARESFPISIPGRGSKLIGGTVRTELSRSEVESVLLDGFFPHVSASDRPQAPRRAGLTALGLPYASDPAVSRHLAAFLARGGGSERPDGQSFVHPTAILFNGGVTRSPIIRERIATMVGSWVEAEGGKAPQVLLGADPDVAVSRGAAHYARVRHAGGVRIRGGTARAYYVGVERAELAVPGVPPSLDALCVAPFGMEEGSEVTLDEPFGLIVGEPVSFRFFGSAERPDDVVGTVVDPSELNELAPIETTLEGDPGTVVHVRLRARVTEVGTLELAAVDAASDRTWQLSFNVRMH